MRIRTQCKKCGLPYPDRIEPGGSTECLQCGDERHIATEGWLDEKPGSVETCPVCECRHLYRQRDFNRALGCTLVLIGAIFVPWTYGLSLLILALVDLGFYLWLPEAVVCYKCDTVFRDARPGKRQGAFDLLKHDVLKYGKSWESAE